MIPMPLMALAAQYGTKILAGLVVVAFITGLYYSWKNEVVTEERGKWEARDAETARQGQELLKLKQHETNHINKSNQEKAYNAAKIYNDHYARIIADRERMPIKPATTNCDINALPGTGKSIKGIGGTGARIYGNEFQEADLRQIEHGQLVCEQLLNILVGEK